LRDPLRAFASVLKAELGKETEGYHFPQQGIGRIKRTGQRMTPNEPIYKGWLSYMAMKPSASSFEKNLILFLGLLPNDPDWVDVVIAGGLFQTRSR
jgi:hypothetical protein